MEEQASHLSWAELLAVVRADLHGYDENNALYSCVPVLHHASGQPQLSEEMVRTQRAADFLGPPEHLSRAPGSEHMASPVLGFSVSRVSFQAAILRHMTGLYTLCMLQTIISTKFKRNRLARLKTLPGLYGFYVTF